MMLDSKFLRDATERVLSTYVQAFLGLLLVSASDALNMSVLKAAAVAAVPAALSVLKTLIATRFGDPASASLVE